MKKRPSSRRDGLKVALLATAILSLGLTSYARDFTSAMRQAEGHSLSDSKDEE